MEIRNAISSAKANDLDVDDLVNLAEEISYKKCKFNKGAMKYSVHYAVIKSRLLLANSNYN